MFQRGVSPVRLSQLDVRPAVEAAQMVAAAKANLNSSINQSILDFSKKQEKKKQDKIGIKAIQNMYGLDDSTAKAVYSDEIVRDAFVQKQKADNDLARKQRQELELQILQDERKRVQEQRDIFSKSIAVNTATDGTVDVSGVRQSFIDLGGTDESVLGNLYLGRDYKLDQETGLVLVDGEPKFNVGKAFVEPTEEEKKKSKLDLEKKQAEIDKLRAEITKIQSKNEDPFEGKDARVNQFMSANPQFKTYEEAEKHLREKGLL
jgi:hypothetical protein